MCVGTDGASAFRSIVVTEFLLDAVGDSCWWTIMSLLVIHANTLAISVLGRSVIHDNSLARIATKRLTFVSVADYNCVENYVWETHFNTIDFFLFKST
jgi:hypothetical protein